MEKEFVTYEIALKLKELGFDESCFGYYRPMKEWMMEGTKFNPERHFHGCNWSNPDNTMYFMYVQNSFGDGGASVKNSKFTKAIENIAVPLWQQVIDWLREEHGFELSIGYYFNKIKGKQYDMEMYRDTHFVNPDAFDTVWRAFNSYYEAQEYSILKALQILEDERNKEEKENGYNGR